MVPIGASERARDRLDADELLGELVFGKWKLTSVLGYGAKSAVYAAKHDNGSSLALKVGKIDFVGQSRFYRREASICNAIDLESVPRCLDDGTLNGGLPYMLMERVQGESLATRADLVGGVTLMEAIRNTSKLLVIVAAMHSAGYVHLNIEPTNILRTPDGEIRLVGFGSARSLASYDASGDRRVPIEADLAGVWRVMEHQVRGSRAGASRTEASDGDDALDLLKGLLWTSSENRTTFESATAMRVALIAAMSRVPEISLLRVRDLGSEEG